MTLSDQLRLLASRMSDQLNPEIRMQADNVLAAAQRMDAANAAATALQAAAFWHPDRQVAGADQLWAALRKATGVGG